MVTKNEKMWIDEFMIGHQCHKRQFTCKVTCLTLRGRKGIVTKPQVYLQ